MIAVRNPHAGQANVHLSGPSRSGAGRESAGERSALRQGVQAPGTGPSPSKQKDSGVAPSPRSTAVETELALSHRLCRDLEEIRILADAMRATALRMDCLAQDALRAFDAYRLAGDEARAEQARQVETRISAAHVLAQAAGSAAGATGAKEKAVASGGAR